MNVPQLRFRESRDPLTSITLSQIASEVTRAEKNSSAPIMMISAGSGFVLQSDKYSREMAGQSLKKYITLRKGELAYNHGASKLKPYGCCFKLDEDAARIPFVYHCFKIDKGNADFFAYYLNTPQIDRHLKPLVSSSVRMDGLLNISMDNYMSIPLNIPSITEQQKIAEFLSAIDEKIDSQQSIVASLEAQKKGFMQKIFSQELRFKNENGGEFPKWEEKKLGDICDIVGGGTPSKIVSEYWNGDIPWISSSDISDKSIFNISISRYITEIALKSSATKLCPTGTICVVSRVGVGKVALTDRCLCTSQDFTNLIKISENIVFTTYLLSVKMNEAARQTQGTSIKGITVNEIKNTEVHFPSLPEQQKIADFLSAYDEKIDAERQILTHWKTTKKALLQQMFV